MSKKKPVPYAAYEKRGEMIKRLEGNLMRACTENCTMRGLLSDRPVAHPQTGVIDQDRYDEWAYEVDTFLDPSLDSSSQK